ncbi:MAG: hypothetical protein HQL51_05390 [Magnetococcales bacterium]|nr:hypothetical protein [Magnetococcales bacterium]
MSTQSRYKQGIGSMVHDVGYLKKSSKGDISRNNQYNRVEVIFEGMTVVDKSLEDLLLPAGRITIMQQKRLGDDAVLSTPTLQMVARAHLLSHGIPTISDSDLDAFTSDSDYRKSVELDLLVCLQSFVEEKIASRTDYPIRLTDSSLPPYFDRLFLNKIQSTLHIGDSELLTVCSRLYEDLISRLKNSHMDVGGLGQILISGQMIIFARLGALEARK